MIRKLIYYGNPLLRKKSLPIDTVTDEIKQIGKDLLETLDSTSNGVGLAAVQIGVLLKMFVVRPVIEKEDGTSTLGEAEFYLNPVLSNPSEEAQAFIEGCLSLPTIHAEVIRPCKIHIEALDLEGKKVSKDVEGFHATEIMHENDHLHGTLFIDRTSRTARKDLEIFLQKIKKTYS